MTLFTILSPLVYWKSDIKNNYKQKIWSVALFLKFATTTTS